MKETVAVPYAGSVTVCQGSNPRSLYEHQISAMEQMDRLNQKAEFSTMLVLPTGGGKTLTAAYWLLREAVNQGKKILWIAHRHLLLEQAAETFQKNAFSNLLYNISSFQFRIVSGKHDRPIHIQPTDDILIMSKDSITRDPQLLQNWLKGADELFLVIDEAHHATAKSYRKVIEFVRHQVPHVKLLGLTATPFRTAENEQGLLSQIFTDGIVYKIDLKDLIKIGILSRPVFEEYHTEVLLGSHLGLNALHSIMQLDCLPDDIAQEIADNKTRNKLIVAQYKNNCARYGQTLVFAVSRIHAVTLKALFEHAGISAAVIMSGTQAEFIGIDISNEENSANIEAYRSGNIQVLINVNILTEGVDLPQTKTVFLTRPTVSSILMTQMIGRALRGERAGGTKEANIVSFIDDWQERIAWVNAETLMESESEYAVKSNDYEKKEIRLISLGKLEEFARIMDETVDTTKLESIAFIKRVPLGMYAFSFLDDDKMERSVQVLVYDSTKTQYDRFLSELPLLFAEYHVEDECLPEEFLAKLVHISKSSYFDDDMLPAYDQRDIGNLLKYYAQKECVPRFIPFDELDRKALDLGALAKELIAKDMRKSEEKAYLDGLWNDEAGVIRIYFNKKAYFIQQLRTEMDKLDGDFPADLSEPEVILDTIALSRLTLHEMEQHNPACARELKDTVYAKYQDEDGKYVCRSCGYHSPLRAMFQIDHIKPMAKGGQTVPANLQLLCRPCNLKKSDQYE